MTKGNEVRVTPLAGQAIAPFLDEVAGLRITVFREYPYLYDGSLAYERDYLHALGRSPQSVCVLAIANSTVVGAATGLPLAETEEAFAAPLRNAGYATGSVFYLAESVLLPAYRGRGIGHRFFHEREAHAQALGGFALAAFCAVERPANHPRRPPGYQPLDAFWQRRGYTRHHDLQTTYSWKDLDEPGESAKSMGFWLRPL